MGNVDSVPGLSQTKSLFQVITGDARGAERTQRNFANTVPGISQAQSAVLGLTGRHDEARRVQLQFLGAQSPGAKFALDHLGRRRRSVLDISKSVDDMVTGKATVGEGFDTTFGISAAGMGGAVGANALVGSEGASGARAVGGAEASAAKSRFGRTKVTAEAQDQVPLLCRGGRSTDPRSMEFFDPLLNNVQVGAFLPMLEDIRLDSLSKATMDPNSLATTLMTVFTVLKLMTARHPKSKPYYEEICARIYPQQPLLDCEEHLFQMLTKDDYRSTPTQDGSRTKPEIESAFESPFLTLKFEMHNLLQQTELGRSMTKAICLRGFKTQEEVDTCLGMLPTVFGRLKAGFKRFDSERIRRKRESGCKGKWLEMMTDDQMTRVTSREQVGNRALWNKHEPVEIRSVKSLGMTHLDDDVSDSP